MSSLYHIISLHNYVLPSKLNTKCILPENGAIKTRFMSSDAQLAPPRSSFLSGHGRTRINEQCFTDWAILDRTRASKVSTWSHLRSLGVIIYHLTDAFKNQRSVANEIISMMCPRPVWTITYLLQFILHHFSDEHSASPVHGLSVLRCHLLHLIQVHYHKRKISQLCQTQTGPEDLGQDKPAQTWR